MERQKIAIVTGANTGLGFAVVRQLCQHYRDEAVVYLTARDEERGLDAVKQLKEEGLNPAFHLLDVTDDQSVITFADYIRQEHGGVDIVISNAAARISPDISQADQLENFINTNNHGAYRMIQAFGTMLRDGARYIIVAGTLGSLRHLDPKLHSKFDVEHLSLADVERVMDEYKRAYCEGYALQEGWPAWIIIPSKIGQVATAKIFARDMTEEAQERNVLINAVCPGFIDTDASRPWFNDMSSAKTPDEGAVDVVWLATLPEDAAAPYGELVKYRQVLPWQ